MELRKQLEVVKSTACELANLDDATRNAVLRALAKKCRERTKEIISENQKDLALMDINDPRYDRLLLDEIRINAIANDLESVTQLESPLGKILESRTRPNGLSISKISVPLGVVAVIYESRPNVTIDVFSLCFKSGNACVLKGGKEAFHSNTILVLLIHEVLKSFDISTDSLLLFPADRDQTAVLLEAHDLIDVCIPRGSQALIEYVREHAKVPVIETGAGIVHIYVDHSADKNKARDIIRNAKTRRVSVCNALDCLLVHQDYLANLPFIIAPLQDHQVEIFADTQSYNILQSHYPSALLHHAKPEDYGREFLSYKMAIKTVENISQAIAQVSTYSSKHSEAILTEDKTQAAYYARHVDAAVIYINASTAFTDGGEFGMGAEIGISTQKLHARGPMGLDALTTYQWLVIGDGQIRA